MLFPTNKLITGKVGIQSTGQHKFKYTRPPGIFTNLQMSRPILQVQSRDPRPVEQLYLAHRRWACWVALARDLQSICSPWVRAHLESYHRTRSSAPGWQLSLLWQHWGEPDQTRHLRLPKWETRGYLPGKKHLK